MLTTPHDKILINHVFDSFYRYYYTRDTVPMILNERGCAPIELRRNLSAAQIFVEHLDIHKQLFDKAYYYIFAKDQKWQWWGSPSRYRHEIDQYIKELNGELIQCVRNNGELLFETKQFRIWKIR